MPPWHPVGRLDDFHFLYVNELPTLAKDSIGSQVQLMNHVEFLRLRACLTVGCPIDLPKLASLPVSCGNQLACWSGEFLRTE